MASTPQHIPAEKIRERAYELWERNHRPEDMEMQFWLVAERELRAELEEHGQSEQKSDQPPGGDPSDLR